MNVIIFNGSLISTVLYIQGFYKFLLHPKYRIYNSFYIHYIQTMKFVIGGILNYWNVIKGKKKKKAHLLQYHEQWLFLYT
jgi:cytochrome c oxidase assembly factor CtaG